MPKLKKTVIYVPQNLMFHFYSRHPKEMTKFYLWFVARNFLDDKHHGFCDLNDLIKFTKTKRETIIKTIRHSKLFRGYKNNRIYYVSLFKTAKTHHLRMRTKFRIEYPSKKYLDQLRIFQRFKAYIIKCYFENDPRKKIRLYTNGRISTYGVAKKFGISRRTVQRLTKLSKAKISKNIVEHRNIKFKNKFEFGSWLLNNPEERINGYAVENNYHSYFIRFKAPGEYYLCQHLPNIFRFTGVRLVTSIIRGNGSLSSLKCKKCWSLDGP